MNTGLGERYSRVPATDEDLVAAATAGNATAFAELYRRHRPVAARVASRVTGNREDAHDAVAEAFTRVFGVVSTKGLRHCSSFRSYLLTTVRHVALDKVRHRGRTEPTDELEPLDGVSPRQGPADVVERSEDERLVREAFKELPPRSRSVLWLVDVEDASTHEAAEALGLTPNNVAQIAVRARGRLRHGYIQAHVAGPVEERCRFAVERMGPYVDGRLRPHSMAKVDGHLDGCLSCQGRLDQLRTAGVVTRRSILPLLVFRRVTDLFRRPRKGPPPGVASPEAFTQPASLGTHLVSAGSNPALVDLVQGLGQSPAVQRVVACVAAGTMTLGASSLALRTYDVPPSAGQPSSGPTLFVAAPAVSPDDSGAQAPGAGMTPPAPTSLEPAGAGVVGPLQSLSGALAAGSRSGAVAA
ncbi:MAG: sigma-70 family RNA polymerase sigma factor, partial [Actinomycetota bacterium]|nr:sigma-70 family RNA polymerase sigma factor [Actinomycetota bacterium]